MAAGFREYYKTIFLGLLDLALVNAYLTHKEASRLAGGAPIAAIPAHLGKRVVLRRTPKAVGVRKKTRREILREDNEGADEEAEPVANRAPCNFQSFVKAGRMLRFCFSE
ncbi:hypothetical protein PInf_025175 [Phytophthora infestans]|nr:hypothetical protein PInf_025175 [Phytophthora infestans]